MKGDHISALVFDMDGLLLDSERIMRDVWRRAAAMQSCVLDDDLYVGLIGTTERDAVDRLIARFGEALDPVALLEQVRRGERVLQTEAVPLRPGALELLDWARAVELPCAVATSTRRANAAARLARAGVVDRFVTIVGGDDVERGKPHPDIYERAARELGLETSACVALEDSEHGVLAASRAGMCTIMVPDLVPPSARAREAAVAIATSLHEVIDWLRTRQEGRRPETGP